jgi:hypothetical protein
MKRLLEYAENESAHLPPEKKNREKMKSNM